MAGLVLLAATVGGPRTVAAQWSTTYESFYLPGSFNWQFRHNYPAADRLFNAFDFGHAILYEELLTNFRNSVDRLERMRYEQLTKEILVHPPRVPLEETAIEVAYAKLAPEAKVMFDWAHLLHRQIYDVWADERMPIADKDAKVQELIRYYKTRPDLAFSSLPKTMVLMQEQPYSLAFRKGYPKFNGLIWAYHWLQIGLYEPLLTGRNVDERQAGIRATVARFWQMLQDSPRTMPHVMPMTAAVAPEFAKRYPEAAIIFDNLHSMHDVVSDILANPMVPRDRKRAEIILAAGRYRDATSFVMTEQAWRTMARDMGVENMGGVAGNSLPPLPTPTVSYGAVMTHDDRTGEMTGFSYGEATGGAHAGMQHGATSESQKADSAKAGAVDHSRMSMPRDSTTGARDTTDHAAMGHTPAAGGSDSSMGPGQPAMQQMMVLHMRMMEDPVIRKRMMADTAMRLMMREMMVGMPAEHRARMEGMMREAAPTRAVPKRPRASPARAKPRTSPSSSAGGRPPDPHAGHQPAAKPSQPPAAKKPSAKKDSMPGMDHSKMVPPRKP